MQNQPNINYQLENEHINLPSHLPICVEDHTFNDDKILGLHIHNCLEIGYCCKGAGIFFVDNKILPFSEGDIYIILGDQYHKAQSNHGGISTLQFIFLDPELLLKDFSAEHLSGISLFSKRSFEFENILSHADYPDMTVLVTGIIEELTQRKKNFESVVKGMVLALLKKSERIISFTNKAEAGFDRTSLLYVSSALNYISANYMNPIKVSELAFLCMTSLTNFRRNFKASLQVSPLSYIEKVRIQTAAILLSSTDFSVLEISLKVGYSSLSSFNRNFKRSHGVSPRDWRSLSRNNP